MNSSFWLLQRELHHHLQWLVIKHNCTGDIKGDTFMSSHTMPVGGGGGGGG